MTFPVVHHYTSYAKKVKLAIATLRDNCARTSSKTAQTMIENSTNFSLLFNVHYVIPLFRYCHSPATISF